jgi:hypothetical protein
MLTHFFKRRFHHCIVGSGERDSHRNRLCKPSNNGATDQQNQDASKNCPRYIRNDTARTTGILGPGGRKSTEVLGGLCRGDLCGRPAVRVKGGQSRLVLMDGGGRMAVDNTGSTEKNDQNKHKTHGGDCNIGSFDC